MRRSLTFDLCREREGEAKRKPSLVFGLKFNTKSHTDLMWLSSGTAAKSHNTLQAVLCRQKTQKSKSKNTLN